MYIPPPSTLPAGSIVDSYRRDSGGISQDRSTAQQLAELEDYCKTHQLIHRHKFVDDARSGGSIQGRDDFQRMMSLYEDPDQRPAGLLLWNYARFARDVDDAQLNKIRIRQWGVAIHSLNDSVPEGEHGRIIEFLIDIANEEKRKQTSKDTKRGLMELVKTHGCVPGGTPTGIKREAVQIGIRRDGKPRIAHRWTPDPAFKKRILKAFQLRSARVSIGEIHRQTKLMGGINSYATFFANPIYKGTLIFGDYIKQDYCEAMVPPELWDRVQVVQNNYARTRHTSSEGIDHPRRANSRYLLSGIAFHLLCGSPLYGHTSKQKNGKKSDSYFCTRAYRRRDCVKHRIPRETLENAVISALQDRILQPEFLDAVYQKLQRSQTGRLEQQQEDRKDLAAQIAKIKRQINNVTESLAEMGNSKSLIERLRDLELQETDLLGKLASLDASAEQPVPQIPRQLLESLAKDFKTIYNRSELPTRRAILRALIHRIEVVRENNTLHGYIHLYYPPQLPPPNVPTPPTPSGPQSVILQKENPSFHVGTGIFCFKFLVAPGRYEDSQKNSDR